MSDSQSQPACGPSLSVDGLELRLDFPLTTDASDYSLQGELRGHGAELFFQGGSLKIRNVHTGLIEEAFFTGDGRFAQMLSLQPDSDTPLALMLCDGLGDAVATVNVVLRHRSAGAAPGDSTVPTLPRELAVEVLTQSGQRRQQMLAPAGVRLPAKFTSTYRTTDQSGRIVVPLWEDGRLLHQVVVGELDPRLPVGADVEIELQIEADLAMRFRVVVRHAGRCEVVELPPPAPPQRPTPETVTELVQRIEALLPEFSGHYGNELRDSFAKCHGALVAALDASDDVTASACLDQLRDQREQMELAKLQVQYPPLPRLTQMVKRCLFEAAKLADRTGRDREQMFAQIYTHEQAAEQAYAEKNAGRYREAFDSLRTLAGDLERLQDDMSPVVRRGPEPGPSPHDVADALKDLKAYVAAVLPAAQLKGQADFVQKLNDFDQQRDAWADRGKREPGPALHEVRKALAEVARIEQALTAGRSRGPAGVEGMLEGSA